MRSPKTLKLIPNPWHGELDHNERPACAVPYPYDGKSQYYAMRWLGATPAKDEDGDQYFVFDCLDEKLDFKAGYEPVAVANDGSQATARWRQAIAAGEVLAADFATYCEVFGKEAGFLSPAEILAKEKAQRHVAHGLHGRGAPDPKPYTTWEGPSERVARERQEAIDAATKAQTARAEADAKAEAEAAQKAAEARRKSKPTAAGTPSDGGE